MIFWKSKKKANTFENFDLWPRKAKKTQLFVFLPPRARHFFWNFGGQKTKKKQKVLGHFFDFCENLKILILEAAAVTKHSFARYSRQIPYFNAVLHDTLIKILTCSAPTTTTTPALLPTIAQARLRNRSGLEGSVPQTPLTVRDGPGGWAQGPWAQRARGTPFFVTLWSFSR